MVCLRMESLPVPAVRSLELARTREKDVFEGKMPKWSFSVSYHFADYRYYTPDA